MKVLVVSAHPCADSFNKAVVAAAVAGLEAGGHDVTALDLYAIGFDPTMSRDDLESYRARAAAPDPVVRAHGGLITATDALVFVYPTWWTGLPAILKGWLERVFVPGVAFDFDERGKVRGGLRNVRRIVGISTYGGPWMTVKLANDNGRRILTRALRLNCGWRTPTTWLGLYSLDTIGQNEREAFLDRVHHAMEHLR